MLITVTDVLNGELGETREIQRHKERSDTEKMKRFSAEKDKSKYIHYLSQHNRFEIQIMSAREIFVKR